LRAKRSRIGWTGSRSPRNLRGLGSVTAPRANTHPERRSERATARQGTLCARSQGLGQERFRGSGSRQKGFGRPQRSPPADAGAGRHKNPREQPMGPVAATASALPGTVTLGVSPCYTETIRRFGPACLGRRHLTRRRLTMVHRITSISAWMCSREAQTPHWIPVPEVVADPSPSGPPPPDLPHGGRAETRGRVRPPWQTPYRSRGRGCNWEVGATASGARAGVEARARRAAESGGFGGLGWLSFIVTSLACGSLRAPPGAALAAAASGNSMGAVRAWGEVSRVARRDCLLRTSRAEWGLAERRL
jgi:hypothetical protein